MISTNGTALQYCTGPRERYSSLPLPLRRRQRRRPPSAGPSPSPSASSWPPASLSECRVRQLRIRRSWPSVPREQPSSSSPRPPCRRWHLRRRRKDRRPRKRSWRNIWKKQGQNCKIKIYIQAEPVHSLLQSLKINGSTKYVNFFNVYPPLSSWFRPILENVSQMRPTLFATDLRADQLGIFNDSQKISTNCNKDIKRYYNIHTHTTSLSVRKQDPGL